VRHVARQGDIRNAYTIKSESLDERDYVVNLGLDGIMILK
jgi:hypothetical protein